MNRKLKIALMGLTDTHPIVQHSTVMALKELLPMPAYTDDVRAAFAAFAADRTRVREARIIALERLTPFLKMDDELVTLFKKLGSDKAETRELRFVAKSALRDSGIAR